MKKINLLLIVLFFTTINIFAQSEKIYVSDLKSFLEAIKSDVEIIVTKNIYFDQELLKYLGKSSYYEIDTSDNSFLTEIKNSIQYGLIIKNVNNLTIRNQDTINQKNIVKLLTVYDYRNVIEFKNCNYINLNNLYFGHSVKNTQFCVGDVLVLTECQNVNIRNCNLFGSGATGISSNLSKYINCYNTIIHDCSYSAIWLDGTRDFSLNNCIIKDNKTVAYLFYLGSSTDIYFNNCEIYDNSESNLEGNSYLFDACNSNTIIVENCIIKNNSVPYITQNNEIIKFINSPLTNNPPNKGDYFDNCN